ncbi:hypothetical protein JDV02_009252 [Purpureocillium takamizusanense]|uniref:Endonuclease/exonuclease/phosphatase domain-containing protein n=1 Tax=Purpureocillium takamizusanense TaxID=2060973 RepID=A0A9Q8VFZ8_9HYPO|nr:uncharacterized protein JDV02_009252 [Purpureocillium takamizusanense]UNI23434.1 hypothetical protein JDV02_009252 [Purpureocillium takamizusanense]
MIPITAIIRVATLAVLFGLSQGRPSPAGIITLSGGLVYRSSAPPSTFDYNTDKPGPKNWVGLYRASGGGPDDQKHVEDSLAWAYAPDSQGSVRLSTSSLPSGKYKAYFLADDGYKWLADPIEATLVAGQGSLSIVEQEQPFTFKYSTDRPKPKNWIGVYHARGGGPDNQEQGPASLAWDWAPDGEGTLHIPVSKLQPGDYKAYFLEDNGYKWLANPIEIFLPGKGPIKFIVDKFKTANAQHGEPFKASIRGLLANPPDAKTKFSILKASSSASWVSLSTDGTLSGTPSASSTGNAEVTIEAAASDGSKAQLTVTIPIVDSGSLLVSRLRVLSFNLWFGGTQVNDYHNKQVRFLSETDVDLVGLQESTGGHAIRLAQALGWDYWQGNDVGIISRYPIAEVYTPTSNAGAVRVQLGRDKDIIIWNAHLGYTPYGPYDFCFDKMEKEIVLNREAQSGRTGQMHEITDRMKEQLTRADKVPVLLTGDFNAPSHLDWTDAAKDLHCGIGSVKWPTSMYPQMAGLVDSYRAVHENPIEQPGITWSPIYLTNEGRSEPKDRIDFIFHKGLRVLSSETVVVGSPKPEPDHQDNEWTSDHAAVMTDFEITR